ncbi:DUF6169 family protein [Mucilaginibacter glaciei]|uniref:Uncharacterized protein n=1 Tax=Mucilaginibacter glaciei TaxID=2772109 RepID=A0A926NT97_9SPHI|nr:DUF6169 family protein [Mucilaginibacter glaciei]MBD1394607.1 hypothetical protein [Mucilaginibacter glaciei]
MDEYTGYVNNYPLLLQKGYAFGFHKKKFNADSKNKNDELVASTIYKICLDFLQEQGIETVLLYHCDANDGKQACRNKLFNKWSDTIVKANTIVKHSIEVVIGDDTDNKKEMYLGFLTLNENPLIEEIKTEFNDFSINLIAPKE